MRILVPFVIWSIIYACVWGEPVDNLKSLMLNFNYSAWHLWFVYMLSDRNPTPGSLSPLG